MSGFTTEERFAVKISETASRFRWYRLPIDGPNRIYVLMIAGRKYRRAGMQINGDQVSVVSPFIQKRCSSLQADHDARAIFQ